MREAELGFRGHEVNYGCSVVILVSCVARLCKHVKLGCNSFIEK